MISKAISITVFLLVLGISLALAPALAQTPKAQATSTSTEAMATPTRPLTASDLDELRAELRSSRKQAVAQTLKLTDQEATRFWPVYDQYASELTTIKNDQYQLIAEYANTYG